MLKSIVLNGNQVSDLFFNSELKNYNNIPARHRSLETNTAALLIDATEFSEHIGGQVSPQDLVKDFLARV